MDPAPGSLRLVQAKRHSGTCLPPGQARSLLEAIGEDHVARTIDDATGRELRRVAACAGRGHCHRVAHADIGLGNPQRESFRAVAVDAGDADGTIAIGFRGDREVARADQARAFAMAVGLAGRTRERLQAVRATRYGTQRAAHPNRALDRVDLAFRPQSGARDDREVLPAVAGATGLGLAKHRVGIVRVDAVRTQIDAERAVAGDPVALDAVAPAGRVHHAHAIVAI